MSISVGGLVLALTYSHDADTILSGLIALAALAAGWVAGAIRINRIAGPLRLPEDAPLLPFASVFFGGLGFFIFAANVIARLPPAGASDAAAAPSDFANALMACVPPIIGLIAVWVGDSAILSLAGQKLGMSARLIPRGLGIGLLASLIMLPVLFFASEVTDFIYKLVHYEHELEHPMLRAMGETPSALVRASLVIGACVIVPIWEETLFRGHLQTLLGAAFGRLLSGPATEPSFPPLNHPESSPASMETDRPVKLEYAARPRRVLRYKNTTAWLAVIVTSALFALLHPLWSAPIIFLLALGLGYAYERTGNLWVSIGMHAAFNSVSTFWYLAHGAN